MLGSGELTEAEVGLRPVNAVDAFGVAVDQRVRLGILLPGDAVVPAAVVHAKAVAIAEDGDIHAAVALPGRIGDEGDPPRSRLVQAQCGAAAQALDQRAIGEQLETGSDVRHLRTSRLGEGQPHDADNDERAQGHGTTSSARGLTQSTGPGRTILGAVFSRGRTASQSTPWNPGSGSARISSSP